MCHFCLFVLGVFFSFACYTVENFFDLTLMNEFDHILAVAYFSVVMQTEVSLIHL